ncbi:hypothetical protein [Fibrella aestuarina]|nr:hypothetical protein [Fibrella aestuarina]
MRTQLLDLYTKQAKAFVAVRQKLGQGNRGGPFLPAPHEAYASQPRPLLIVGQETNGWGEHLDDIAAQMAVYDGFAVGQRYNAKPFWNMTRQVERLLGHAPHSCAWANLSRFDIEGKRAQGEQAAVIATLDHLLLDEVRILTPKVCLFYTGPELDHRLQSVFTGLTYYPVDGYTPRQFARLSHPALPLLSFRTYHPRYLRQSRMEAGVLATLARLTQAEPV